MSCELLQAAHSLVGCCSAAAAISLAAISLYFSGLFSRKAFMAATPSAAKSASNAARKFAESLSRSDGSSGFAFDFVPLRFMSAPRFFSYCGHKIFTRCIRRPGELMRLHNVEQLAHQ